MKVRLIVLLFIATFFTSISDVNAAFIIKKSRTEETNKAVATTEHSKERVSNRRELLNNLTALKRIALHEGEHDRRPRDTSGWEGIVALVCGVFGAFIPAIIFGAIGMAKGKQNRGLAKAGFIIGLVYAGIILLVLMIAAFSGIGWA